MFIEERKWPVAPAEGNRIKSIDLSGLIRKSFDLDISYYEMKFGLFSKHSK